MIFVYHIVAYLTKYIVYTIERVHLIQKGCNVTFCFYLCPFSLLQELPVISNSTKGYFVKWQRYFVELPHLSR